MTIDKYPYLIKEMPAKAGISFCAMCLAVRPYSGRKTRSAPVLGGL